MNFGYGFGPHGGFHNGGGRNHRGGRHRGRGRRGGFGGIRGGFIVPIGLPFPFVFVI